MNAINFEQPTSKALNGPISEINEQHADVLFGLIHVGPKLLRRFVDGTQHDLCLIQTFFKDAESSENYKAIIDPILRLTHSIKGSAALFDLTLYTQLIHKLEVQLTELNKRSRHLTLSDFDVVIKQILQIEHALKETQNILEQFSWVQSSARSSDSKTATVLGGLHALLDELAPFRSNQLNLHYGRFNFDQLPEDYHSLALDVITQLLRNAAIHGIESPEERRACGKDYRGNVYLSCGITDEGYELLVQDDGRGLDTKLIRRHYKNNLVAGASENDCAGLIFEAGFSTAKTASTAAGHGVGLDLVKQRVAELNGRIDFQYTQGNGCLFKILLPLLDKAD